MNDTLHATVHHSAELIRNNETYSLGALSEEGLEGNNKDIRNYLERFCRKTSMINQITDVMNRLLERSDPRISKQIIKQRSQKNMHRVWFYGSYYQISCKEIFISQRKL